MVIKVAASASVRAIARRSEPVKCLAAAPPLGRNYGFKNVPIISA